MNAKLQLTCFYPHFLFPPQHVTSCPWAWRPSLAPRTARRPTRSSPSATPWACPTSRPSGSTRCRTTGTRTTSACTPTSPRWAEPSWTWCTSSSGGPSPWCTTTAQVQVQWVSCHHCVVSPPTLRPLLAPRRWGAITPNGEASGAGGRWGNCSSLSALWPVRLIQKSIAYCSAWVPAGAARVSLPEERPAAFKNPKKRKVEGRKNFLILIL